ncbi:hypothetical protein BHE74_00038461 [Ensete ventricosum]|nr:hypothetical protein BHE74_00038461 [Ensete ventricosum]RZS14534.1 hypothetical protein BHM03_00046243 [Ensete ventricosum]
MTGAATRRCDGAQRERERAHSVWYRFNEQDREDIDYRVGPTRVTSATVLRVLCEGAEDTNGRRGRLTNCFVNPPRNLEKTRLYGGACQDPTLLANPKTGIRLGRKQKIG